MHSSDGIIKTPSSVAQGKDPGPSVSFFFTVKCSMKQCIIVYCGRPRGAKAARVVSCRQPSLSSLFKRVTRHRGGTKQEATRVRRLPGYIWRDKRRGRASNYFSIRRNRLPHAGRGPSNVERSRSVHGIFEAAEIPFAPTKHQDLFIIKIKYIFNKVSRN